MEENIFFLSGIHKTNRLESKRNFVQMGTWLFAALTTVMMLNKHVKTKVAQAYGMSHSFLHIL